MAEPIRVLQVMASLNRGGAESVVMDWLHRVDRTVVTFDFVVNAGGPYAFEQEAEALGSRVFHAPKFRGWNAASYALWWRSFLMKHPEWQVVHAHHTMPAFIYLGVARGLGRAAVAHSHIAGRDRSVEGVVRTVLRWPLRHVAGTHLACSELAGTWMFGHGTPVRVIPNGIDSARFAFDRLDRLRLRRALGLEEAFVVGHVGRFSRQKNHARLLRVFASLANQEPSARLLVVGDGELRGEIEEDVAELGLEGRVILAGVRKDIPALLSAMDALLFPSYYEGLPVTVVEAQASGLPCVVSDAVTPEVALTDLVTFVSLDQPDDVWVGLVIKEAAPPRRAARTEEILMAGYDSKQVAAQLQAMYLALTRRSANVPGGLVARLVYSSLAVRAAKREGERNPS